MAIVGFVDSEGPDIYNAAAVLNDGRITLPAYRKIHLPNYGVFHEVRTFKPGKLMPTYAFDDATFGVNIRQDIRVAGRDDADR